MTIKEDYFRRKAAKAIEHNKKTSESWRARIKDPITLFTGLLAVGTAALVVVGALQYLTLEKTDETNRIGLRPYISATAITVDAQRFPLYWSVDAVLENSGGTPPVELKYVIRSSPELPLDPEEVFQRPSNVEMLFHVSIAPKGKIQVSAGRVLSNFFESSAPWYVSGAIHYRDQFDHTPERVSKFCFALVAAKNYSANATRPGYDLCPYWNCTDKSTCAEDRAAYDNAVRSGAIRPTKQSTDVPEVPIGTSLPFLPAPLLRAK